MQPDVRPCYSGFFGTLGSRAMNELPASNTHLSGDEKTATLSGRGFSEQLTLLPQPTAGVGPEISEAERNVAAAESPSATPELLGFDSLQELGRGGMGVVYRARQTSLNRTVALKMILSSEHAGEGARLRFLAEAETIAKVQHPGIVQVYAYGTHKDHPYIALEFIDGGSLDRVLAQETLLPRDAARLVAQVAEAIHVAHQAGIIHRDLKPANVLLANVDRQRGGLKATPKITDFGLSKQINTGEGMTATGVIVGTPSYMAPEQAEGQKSVGPAVDIYALGAILYECLTGRPPFKAATPLDTILQAVSDEPIPPQRLQPTTPKDLDTICLKCLRKDPAKRYASAAALAEDLHNWLAGKPITARPVGRLERGVKWCKCYPAVAALVVVSTLAAIVASGLAAWAIQAEEAAVAERDAKAVALQAEQKALRAETEQRRRAEEQTRLANSVSRFLRQDVLQLADPATQRADQKLQYNADVKLRDVVLRAAQAIEGKFADHPLEEAEIRMTLGLTLLGMGQPGSMNESVSYTRSYLAPTIRKRSAA
jgi:predicted Ser/Thr protein kinase